MPDSHDPKAVSRLLINRPLNWLPHGRLNGFLDQIKFIT
jgi:hypothetical protein